MRLALVFPPQANPTYAPLGVTSLAAFLRSRAPACELSVHDLNIEAWEWAAQEAEKESPAVAGALRFFRGAEGDFFDREEYAARRETWGEAEKVLTRAGADVKRFLNAREIEPGTEALLDRFVRRLLENDPEVVGFSLFSLGQLPWALALALRLKEAAKPGTRILLGGAASTAFSAEDAMAACPFLDGIVLGEGETALLALCRGATPDEIPGLVHRKAGSLVKNRPAPFTDFPASPPPDFSDLPLGRYLNPAPVLPVILSRGCKWRRCRFCAHNTTYGRYRAKDAQRTADELAACGEKYGARHFYFADLYVDAPELGALSDALLTRKLRVNFHVLGRPTGDYTAELLEKASAAGCRWISWGVESGSARLLDVAGKGTDPATVREVLKNTRRAGISNLMMMLYGLPGSTDAELEETFRHIEEVYDAVDAMTATSLVLFEGAPFARRAKEYGLSLLGAQEEVRVGGVPICSTRLDFQERADDGTLRPPRGPVEAAAWHRRRRWLGDVPFLEGLSCEHYLLYVSQKP
jgi:radical SAM superfamily enzyme YgiQ (UPF0313 family)